MARKTVSLLSQESLEKIHKESLKILENIGIQVDNPRCQSILEKAGAKRIGQSDIMRLPSQMVMEAMGQISKEFELVHPLGKRITIPGNEVLVGTRVKMPKVLDYGASECRAPKRQDVINLCHIHNNLPKASIALAIQHPCADVPLAIDVADTLGLVFSITGNVNIVATGNVEDTRVSLDIAQLAVGSDNTDQDPGLFVEVNTTSPLKHGNREGDIFLHVTERHIPIDTGPMPISGVATPFTLAGTLAVSNAEQLYLCTLANLVWPGAKVIHAVTGSIMNMQAANLSMGGAETCLLSSAEIALAKYYGLSTSRMGGYTDSYYPDIQAGIEKTAALLMLAQSGADIIAAGGPLSCAAHHSYEQVVIDYDIWEMCERIATEIEVNDDTLAYQTVAEVGPGGSFMVSQHTMDWVRSEEHYYGGSFNRTLLQGEEKTMLSRARERVQSILQRPVEYRAPQDAIKLIKQYVCDYAKEKKVDQPEWTV